LSHHNLYSVHCTRRSLENQLPCFILIEEDLTIPQLGPRCKKMHGRRRSSTFHHGTDSVRHPACLSRPRLRKQARDYQRLCFDWVYEPDINASTSGRLLACEWTACGRENDRLLLLLSRLLQGHPQNPKRLEIWFLQISDYQFISTIAPMQKWLSALHKHDTDIILVFDGR